MPKVKAHEIQAVRDILANPSNQDKSFQHFDLVAKWINSFSNEKMRLLDVGCGNGVLSTHIDAQYAGIDPIEHKDRQEDIDFQIGLGESIPHPDKSFDYVLIKDAINYFASLTPLLADVSRVLTDNGALLVTELVGPRYAPGKQKLKNMVKKHLRIRWNIWDATYLNFYTSHDVIRAAERRGLSTSYRYVGTEPRYYIVMRKVPGADGL